MRSIRLHAFAVAAAGLAAAYLAVNLTALWLTGPYAWDDGAITLAFARTLAEHGRFALTPASEVVEGSSSLLWTGLLAALHRARPLDFEGFVHASQLAAFAATTVLLVLVERRLRPALPQVSRRAVVVGLLGTLPQFTAELQNGMEMSLFALLLVALVTAFEARAWVAVALLVPLALLARFEAVLYLGGAALAVAVARPDRRRAALALLALVAVAFALVTALRWQVFDALVPNTVLAKTHPPYSGATRVEWLAQKAAGVTEFLGVALWLLAAAAAALALRARRERVDLAVALVATLALFTAVAGRNWGYDGRMFLAALPLLVIVVADTFARERGAAFAVALGRWRWHADGTRLAFALLAAALLATHVANAPLHALDAKTAAFGGFHQRRLPERMQRFMAPRLPEPDDGYGWVTPANFRRTGEALDALRQALGLATLRVLLPDVGGTALCCPRLEVLDAALLTSRTLARTGYAGFGRYLDEMQPDVVETHGFWSVTSGIHGVPAFRAQYVPLVFDDALYWVHARHLAALEHASDHEMQRVPALDALGDVRYAHYRVDRREAIGREPGGVRVLRRRQAAQR